MILKDYIYNKISKLFKLNSPSEMFKEGEYFRLIIDDNMIFNTFNSLWQSCYKEKFYANLQK